MIIYESMPQANFPALEDDEWAHCEEMRQQSIAIMYGWA